MTSKLPPAILIGGIYLVNDVAIRLIPSEDREIHAERRPVVVVSGPTNSDEEWPFVLICPLSSSTRRRTRWDVQLAAAQGGVTRKTWVRIPAVQPLMKTDLQDRSGVLEARVLEQVHARLAQYMGMIN